MKTFQQFFEWKSSRVIDQFITFDAWDGLGVILFYFFPSEYNMNGIACFGVGTIQKHGDIGCTAKDEAVSLKRGNRVFQIRFVEDDVNVARVPPLSIDCRIHLKIKSAFSSGVTLHFQVGQCTKFSETSKSTPIPNVR